MLLLLVKEASFNGFFVALFFFINSCCWACTVWYWVCDGFELSSCWVSFGKLTGDKEGPEVALTECWGVFSIGGWWNTACLISFCDGIWAFGGGATSVEGGVIDRREGGIGRGGGGGWGGGALGKRGGTLGKRGGTWCVGTFPLYAEGWVLGKRGGTLGKRGGTFGKRGGTFGKRGGTLCVGGFPS